MANDDLKKEDHQESFQFLKETRKERPQNRKKTIHQIGYTACLAVLFGVISSFVITVVQPQFQKFGKEEETVNIPIDEKGENTSASEKDNQTQDTSTDSSTDNEGTSGSKVIVQKQSMTLEQYQQLQNKLYAVGWTADKFVVSVTGVTNDTDIFNATYENKGQGSGIIISKDSTQLLIMTEHRIIDGASAVKVTFVDDTTVAAKLVNYDGNTGIAILKVSLNKLSDNTLNDISVAVLGGSLGVTQGMMVLAVGSPLGVNHSILTGNITSVKNSIATIDSNYTIFTTDIVGNGDGSGALINSSGEVIGFVLQDYNIQTEQNTLTALSISELKDVIEKLSNKKDIPYIGMKVNTVTESISTEYQIPRGVYVKQVVVDSPAMEAGFQSGDVIVKIDNQEISTAEGYEGVIKNLEPDDVVKITYKRKGGDDYKTLTSKVTVGVLK